MDEQQDPKIGLLRFNHLLDFSEDIWGLDSCSSLKYDISPADKAPLLTKERLHLVLLANEML